MLKLLLQQAQNPSLHSQNPFDSVVNIVYKIPRVVKSPPEARFAARGYGRGAAAADSPVVAGFGERRALHPGVLLSRLAPPAPLPHFRAWLAALPGCSPLRKGRLVPLAAQAARANDPSSLHPEARSPRTLRAVPVCPGPRGWAGEAPGRGNPAAPPRRILPREAPRDGQKAAAAGGGEGAEAAAALASEC